MKQTYAIAFLLASLPLAAAEPQKSESKSPEPVQISSAAEPQPQESPLVAAARRANRFGKKPGFVITNATLAQSANAGVRMTTTTNQRTVNIPVPPPSKEVEMKVAQDRARVVAAEEATKKRQKEEAAKSAPRPYDDAESLYDDRVEAAAPPKKP